MKHYCELLNGKFFDFEDFDMDAITLGVIATSLSRQCRYNGHCKAFYSVAEHSYLVQQFVKEQGVNEATRQWALLHDAHEIIVGDIIRPVLRLLNSECEIEGFLNPIKQLSNALDAAIIGKFIPDFDGINHKLVGEADLKICALEKQKLLGPTPWHNFDIDPPRNMYIFGYMPDSANRIYTDALREVNLRDE